MSLFTIVLHSDMAWDADLFGRLSLPRPKRNSRVSRYAKIEMFFIYVLAWPVEWPDAQVGAVAGAINSVRLLALLVMLIGDGCDVTISAFILTTGVLVYSAGGFKRWLRGRYSECASEAWPISVLHFRK